MPNFLPFRGFCGSLNRKSLHINTESGRLFPKDAMTQEDFRRHLIASGWQPQGRSNLLKAAGGRRYRFHLSRAGARFEVWIETNKEWARIASAYWRDIEIGPRGSVLGLSRSGMGDGRGKVEVRP